MTKIDDAANPANSVTYTYDENGNRLSQTEGGVTVKYDYNIVNELVRTTDQNGKPVTFDYDLDGVRIAKNTVTSQTNYLIDDGATLIEYDGTSGATLRKYDYGRGLISLTDTDPKTQVKATAFYVVDGLGSTSELTTSTDAIQITYQFDAWGNIFNTVGASGNSKLYTGQQFDPETGLHYFAARYYDSKTGTFLTQDSVTGQLDSPPSLNAYTYVLDNPLRYTDPTGHAPFSGVANDIHQGLQDNIKFGPQRDQGLGLPSAPSCAALSN